MTLPAVNSLPSIDTLLATLQRGGVVITATQRLARHLIQQVSIRQSDVIEKPAILSIESWLIETWSQIEEVSENPRRMLSTAEARSFGVALSRIIRLHNDLLAFSNRVSSAIGCSMSCYSKPTASQWLTREIAGFFSLKSILKLLAWLDVFDARLVRERWLLLEDTYEIITANAATKVSEVLFLSEEAPGPARRGSTSAFRKCMASLQSARRTIRDPCV